MSSEVRRLHPCTVLFVVPSAGFAVLRYLRYQYRYEPTELVIRTGLLFRKERHIPYSRIQNINAVQNVFHRLLKVVEIQIETGGGESAEATMSVLPLSALAEMRERVLGQRDVAAARRETSPASKPLVRLGLRELLLYGFIENRGTVLIAGAFGLTWELGVLDRVFAPWLGPGTPGRGVIRNLVRGVFPNVAMSIGRILFGLAALAVVLVLIRLFSMAWAVVRLYGFTLTLVGDDARTQYGLLTRVAMTVPLRRIQALTVREGPLHRLVARVAVKANTAGGRVGEQEQDTSREYLAPLLHRDRLDEFVRTVVGVSLDNVSWQTVHPRAFRREVKGWLVPAFVACAGLGLYAGWFGVLATPFALLWAIVGARQTVAHLGWATTADAVLFRSGWLWRRVVVVRFAKIQVVTLHSHPFDRRTEMARVHVDTAGGSAGSVVDIPYLPRHTAESLYTQLAREAAARQFQW